MRSMTTRVCMHCEGEMSGVRIVCFKYKEFDFAVLESIWECENCVQKEYEKLFNSLSSKLLKITENDFTVNWEYYSKIQSKYKGNNEFDSMSKLLLGIGVFSEYAQDNWEITDGILNLSPSLDFTRCYFTKYEYAKDYARAYLVDVVYNWRIQRITKVVHRSQVLS